MLRHVIMNCWELYFYKNVKFQGEQEIESIFV